MIFETKTKDELYFKELLTKELHLQIDYLNKLLDTELKEMGSK